MLKIGKKEGEEKVKEYLKLNSSLRLPQIKTLF